MKQHMEWLNSYIDSKLALAQDPLPLELKRIHTLKVYENARIIIENELKEREAVRAGLLAALYHDIARFDQYLNWGTFKDAQSFNHGLAGVRILKNEKRLETEGPHIKRLVLAAVALHNRRTLPVGLASPAALVANLVRDADKLDILRVMDVHLQKKPYNPTVVLGLPDEEDSGSQAVIQTAMRGKCASYGDLRCVNDFRVLLGSWLFSLNFESSRKLFLAMGHGQNLVKGLPENAFYSPVKKFLLDIFEKKSALASQGKFQQAT